MSIQLALQAALSGLRASQQQAAVLSNNVANATTPGYVRKTAELSSVITAGQGLGVQVTAIGRSVDELLIRDARFETSRYTGEEARASALSDFTEVLGQPQDERSYANALNDLKLSLSTLHSMADDEAAQADVVDKAEALVTRLSEASAAASGVQAEARERLAESVDIVNTALGKVSDLNRTIATQQAKGADVGDLMDQRDVLLDQVSQEIGIRTYTRENGMVVVMTRNGQTLLDGTLPAGGQPLQLVGNDLVAAGTVISGDPAGDVQSGRIMGYLQVANQDMPAVLNQLDQLAAGLVTGFQNAEPDPTQPGMFTDGGAAYDPTLDADADGVPDQLKGLASRLTVNGVLSTEPWRVQSGIQAAAPLPPGEQTQIAKYMEVFDAAVTFTAPGLPASSKLADAANAAVAVQHGYRTNSESEMKLRKISADTLENARINRDGVNIDEEMQKLQLVEQSYGASAQVLQAAGRMIDTLLQIAG